MKNRDCPEFILEKLEARLLLSADPSLLSAAGSGAAPTASAGKVVIAGGRYASVFPDAVAPQVDAVVAYLRSWQRQPSVDVHDEEVQGVVGRGEPLYEFHCARCHGATGEGERYVSVSNPEFLAVASDGFLRFAIPMFPWGAAAFAPYITGLAVTGIIYGAMVAWVQRDAKKLIAYSSISHLGFVVLGLMSLTIQGTEVAIYVMIAHGITSGGLFLGFGMLYERRHTRMIEDFAAASSAEDVIAEELGPFDAHFLVPAFFEGGRVTAGGVHYLLVDGDRVPVDQTEFARDSVFGFSTAYLPDYVAEKTGGRIAADTVEHFDLDAVRGDLSARLAALSGNACCVVDAESQGDLDDFARNRTKSKRKPGQDFLRPAPQLPAITITAGWVGAVAGSVRSVRPRAGRCRRPSSR